MYYICVFDSVHVFDYRHACLSLNAQERDNICQYSTEIGSLKSWSVSGVQTDEFSSR